MSRGEIFIIWVKRPAFFFCQFLNASGLPAIFPPCFLHIRPANVFYICHMIYFAMNQHRVILFFCNFYFQKYQSHPGYFHQKSNRVIICWNVVPILLLQHLFFCAFVLIGKSIIWINTKNCCLLGCHCVWSYRRIV